MAERVRAYDAIVWTSDDQPGLRVQVLAQSLQEAAEKLEAEYGKEAIFTLTDPDQRLRLR
jgi:hypothetical protein